MKTPKTLGQIAFEASDDETYRDWIEIFTQHRNEWERIGAADDLGMRVRCIEVLLASLDAR